MSFSRLLIGLEKLGLGPRSRWKDNIKMDLRDMGCEDGRCMELA
jgi:hypothetical protein